MKTCALWLLVTLFLASNVMWYLDYRELDASIPELMQSRVDAQGAEAMCKIKLASCETALDTLGGKP